MTLKEIVEKMGMDVLTSPETLNTEVTDGYTSDLLSDVMANGQQGMVWITLQLHQNIIAVAKLKELAGIILVNNRLPDEDTKKKAQEEKIPLLSTSESAFAISGKLYQLIKTGA